MKYCAEYAALLDAFIDGELPEAQRARVAEHLASCPGCAAYVQDALTLRESFPDPDDTEVPEDFADTVMTAIRAGAAPQAEPVPQSDGEKRKAVRLPWKKALLPLAACFAVALIACGGRLMRWERMEYAFSANAAPAAAEAAPAGGAAESDAVAASVTADRSGDQEEVSIEGQSADEGSALLDTAKFARSSEAAPEYGVQSGAVPESDAIPESAGATPPAPSAAPAAPRNGAEAALDETSITVSLTEEQRWSLTEVLEECVLESSDEGCMVYQLTEQQIDEVLSALEKQAIPASVYLNSGGPYRLYVIRISE